MKIAIYTLLLFIVLHCTLKTEDSLCQSGWFSQPLPVSGQVQDLKFFDANTGLVAMWQPYLILRTTNGGYNWYTVLNNQGTYEFDKIDSITIYARGTNWNGYGLLFRSYNRGATWDSLPVANSETVNGISFVNKDTGWIGGTANALPFLWRTTNAGVSWTVQSDNTGFGRVFFLKDKVNGEYIGWSIEENFAMYKTTNSGQNWFQITNIGSASMLYFADENTGWAAKTGGTRKTTDGGYNWVTCNLPTGFNITGRFISMLYFKNKDTIYGDNGYRLFPSGVSRGIIWVSTNGGVNWNFQQPDTGLGQIQYSGIDFKNNSTGWSIGYDIDIRTNDGGGPIIISGINTFITERPSTYMLEQNYPNPFNPSTRINFSVSSPSYITLFVFDITGKEIVKIYNNEFFTAGNYFAAIDMRNMNLASGMYFYRMTATGKNGNIEFTQTKKMVYIK